MMTESLQLGLRMQLPELILAATAVLVVLLDALLSLRARRGLVGVSLLGTLVAFGVGLWQAGPILLARHGTVVFSSMAISDGVAAVGRLIILLTLTLGLLLGYRGALKRRHPGEFHALLLFAAFGAMVLANAAHLVTLILGLEILSLPLYTLAAFDYQRRAAREAGLKYLLLGAFASGFVALGCALYYAGSGTLSLRAVVPSPEGRMIYSVGMALILSGLMFKGGILPFFAWSPDTYHGAPDFAVGLMAALAKVGTFLLLMRVLPEFLPAIALSLLMPGLLMVAAATMLAGNLLALAQTNIKRMLAYSSVAHAGYMLLGLLVYQADAWMNASSGVLFYLASYAPVLVASFHIISLFPGDEGGHQLAEYTGVGYRSPFLAVIFSVLLLSLAGLPPTGGFMAKAIVFFGAVKGGLTNLVVFAMLVSLIGVYYYLRVIVYMYMREAREDTPVVAPDPVAAGPLGRFAFWVIAAIVAVLGLAPGHLLYLTDCAVVHLGRLPYLPPG